MVVAVAIPAPLIAVPADAPQLSAACIVHCNSPNGKLFLMHGEVKFTTQAGTGEPPALETLEPCASHQFKRWVVAFVMDRLDSEADLRSFVTRQGIDAQPFFVGCGGMQTYVLYQCRETDKHRSKALSFPSGEARPYGLHTFRKSGGQAQKVIETFGALRDSCTTWLSNMNVRNNQASRHTLQGN